MLLLFIATANASPTQRAIEKTGNEHLTNELRDACKTAKDQIHCFGIWLSIAGAEAWFRKWMTHWYYWMIRPKDKSSYRRVQIYNQKRYKAKDGFFFYGDKWQLPPSRYCTSEHSSNSSVWCPNWRKNFNATWLQYKALFIDWKEVTEPTEIILSEPTTTYPTHRPECVYAVTLNPWESMQFDYHLWGLFQYILSVFTFDKKEGKAVGYKCTK